MPSRSVAFILLCVLVGGCSSAEQLARRDAQRCTDRGLKPETKEYNDCMGQVENDRAMRRDARHREMVERSSNPFR